MKRYTYIVHFISSQETILEECDKPIDWKNIKSDSLFQFNIPHGTMTINLSNVTSIEEKVTEIDDYTAEGMMLSEVLARNHFSAKAAAKELGWEPRTVYRKAKMHHLNVKND